MMKSLKYRISLGLAHLLERIQRFSDREKEQALRSSLAHCGQDVCLGKNLTTAGNEHISLGDHTSIGPNCLFYATRADLKIGSYVIFGPGITIATGNHRIDVVGEYMRNVTDEMKLPENDQAVIIEDDVWVGANVTILKGSHIGRGSVIHAGAVVSGEVEPYTIYISRDVRRQRFTPEEILRHEALLREKYGSL